MTQDKAESILSGYRVLDLTEDGCMLCGKILGDLGADVVQIEPPSGSPTRTIGPFYHDTPDLEKSLTWFFLGLNKRGITLNLETADGREIFQKLVKTADFVSPWYLIIAVISALLYRRKTGKGVYLDQAQIEAGITMLAPQVLDYAVNERIAGRLGNHNPYMCPHNAYPCQGDDQWVVIAIKTDEEWQALTEVLGKPDWSHNPKFSTFVARKENEDELDSLIGEWTINYSPEHVMDKMQAAGIPAGVMLASGEGIVNDPQTRHREAFRSLNHREIGPMLYNSPSYHLSKTPAHIWKAAPCLGEDNEYVYKEILGYSDDDIADMLVEGVITTEADVPGA